MKITSPALNAVFAITADPKWPSIVFQTDATGLHSWQWTISWNTYSKSGVETSPANQWDAANAISGLGGQLKVQATANGQSDTVSVRVTGQNPSTQQVTAYLASQAGSDGFDKLLEHESKCKHFNAQGDPIKSFDNGYGMCQLTSPPPSFAQVWNWKLNVDGGLALFAQKRAAAIQYLTQQGRSYTADQLKYEAVCRWNGGSYHVWDAKNGWVRDPNIVCDSQTGNIGWDMTDAENQGKTAVQLHQRDSSSYSGGRQSGAHWRYFGVCYADAILG
jgi:hypothetical protein